VAGLVGALVGGGIVAAVVSTDGPGGLGGSTAPVHHRRR
jgi:hypothetical protein